MGDEKGMELLVAVDIARDALGEVPLHCIVLVRLVESDALTDADRVCIDDERGMSAGIKEDRIGGLRTHSWLGKQIRSDDGAGSIEVAREVSVGSCDEVAAERPEPTWFRSMETCDAHVPPDRRHGCVREPSDVKETRSAEILDGGVDVLPRGLLHEKGTDDHFERGVGRPPVLRTVLPEKPLVHLSGPIHSPPLRWRSVS